MSRPSTLSELLRGLAWGAALLTVLYAGFMLYLYWMQERLAFFPTHHMQGEPSAVGLVYEDVWLTSEDGVELHGWWLPGGDTQPVLLFLHGNAGNISHRLDSLRFFRDLGLQVLIIDYRGYGRSEGKPSEGGTYADAMAAWRYLTETRGIDAGRIVIFGRSLGGAVATELATRVTPGALIVESSFRSAQAVAEVAYPWLPVGWLLRLEYRVEQAMARVNCPVLVIHSPDDEIIPYSHGLALYQAARSPKRFLRLSGGHNDGYLNPPSTYTPGIKSFIYQSLT